VKGFYYRTKCSLFWYLFAFNFSQQSDHQGQKAVDVIERIRNGREVGNTKLAVAALAAHIASTASISLTAEKPPIRENVDSYSSNRIRQRHPPHAVKF
jgi:hypothetical protein